jgi:rsbT antagonist protein RsbS
MSDRVNSTDSTMHIVDQCLVVPVRDNIDEDYMMKLQDDIAANVKNNDAREVIIDVSSMRILDIPVFNLLKKTAHMISVMGSRVVFVGFQPGVASSLVDLDVDFGNIQTVVTMNDGFNYFRKGL